MMSDTDRQPPFLSPGRQAVGLPPVLNERPRETHASVDGRPWGGWATLGLGLCIFIAYSVAQGSALALVGILDGVIADHDAMMALGNNGFVLSLCLLVSTPFAVGLSGLFAALRPGISVWKYLGLVPASWKPIVLGIISLVLLGFGYEAISRSLDRPEIPEFMVEAYRTARFEPLLWFSIILLAPVSEEILFRGFLFKGLEASPVGGVGAVLITALVWAGIHLQYDLFDLGTLFVLGVLLGLFRLRTGSIIPCLIMHIVQNLLATVQVALWLAEQGGAT